jgi:hypothetical protein
MAPVCAFRKGHEEWCAAISALAQADYPSGDDRGVAVSTAAKAFGPTVAADAKAEESLVPDHLAGDLEADPSQPTRHLSGVDPGVPDVADGEGGDQREGI